MCNFISWIEYNNELFYLDNEKLNTKEGRELLKYYEDNNSMDDVDGHGAIRKYYPELKHKGEDIECEDFSSPDNFPKEISDKIKKGWFSNIRFRNPPLQLLSNEGVVEYENIQRPAYAEYLKIRQSAYAEYLKIKQSARAEYKKINQSAYAEYLKIRQSAWAEYEKIQQPARAEYEKIQQSAYAEYLKIRQSAFWETFKKHPNENWK